MNDSAEQTAALRARLENLCGLLTRKDTETAALRAALDREHVRGRGCADGTCEVCALLADSATQQATQEWQALHALEDFVRERIVAGPELAALLAAVARARQVRQS